jgi:hypothetical protein
MKCLECGAENPDYAFFCGRCAADLKAEPKEHVASSPPIRLPTIESAVSKYLPSIQENASKRRRGIFGGNLWHGTIVFTSDRERITLQIEKDGLATILKGAQSKASVELTGPHEAFLEMFRDEKMVGKIPDTVAVTVGGAGPKDSIGQQLAREGTWKMMKRIFE